MHDRVIVITGASSGFGALIARRCAARGARVVLAARTTQQLGQLASELGGATRALAVPADVTRDEDVQQLRAAALAHFGRVDVLVNNAGFGIFDPIASAPPDDLERMLAVNLHGALRCTQMFLPELRAHGAGQIVMMASLGGLVAAPNMGYYCATKFALVGLTRTLMLELDGGPVRCALICPGVAATGFQRHADWSKYPRISRLSTVSADAVAAATLRAIARRTHGEVVIPWYGRILAVAAVALPGLARWITRRIG
jgi:short-subunit dehydrogenase